MLTIPSTEGEILTGALSTKDVTRVRTPIIILKIHFYKLGKHVKLKLEISRQKEEERASPWTTQEGIPHPGPVGAASHSSPIRMSSRITLLPRPP